MVKKDDLVRAHLKIYGKVQNVGYRFFLHRKAASRGLTGWVCNCEGDAVEAVLEGEKKKVEECLKECRKGPPLGRVEKTKIEWEKPTEEFKRFEVR